MKKLEIPQYLVGFEWPATVKSYEMYAIRLTGYFLMAKMYPFQESVTMHLCPLTQRFHEKSLQCSLDADSMKSLAGFFYRLHKRPLPPDVSWSVGAIQSHPSFITVESPDDAFSGVLACDQMSISLWKANGLDNYSCAFWTKTEGEKTVAEMHRIEKGVTSYAQIYRQRLAAIGTN